MTTIRPATADDYLTCVELGAAMAAEGWYSDLPFDKPRVYKLGKHYAEQPTTCFLIAEDEGEVVGFFMGHLIPYFFCDKLYAEEFLMYVRPDRRRGLAGVRLLRAFVAWAKQHGAHEVYFAPSMNQDDPDKIGAITERLGFVRTGGVYRRKL